MDWTICCICQTTKNEGLRGDGGDTYNKIANTIKELSDRNLSVNPQVDLFGNETTENSIVQAFNSHSAVYHHNCVSNICQKLKRAKDKDKKQRDPIPEKRARRSDEQSIPLGQSKCLFCKNFDDLNNLTAGGTLYATANSINAENDRAFTKKLWDRASYLEDSHVLNFLVEGTAAARELYYHKSCLTAFYNRYRDKKLKEHRDTSICSEQQWKSELHFRKILVYIKEQRHQGISVFTVKNLENMYEKYLNSDDIPYTAHITRFAERLKIGLEPSYQNSTGIEIRTIDKSVKLLFSSDVNEIIDRETCPSTLVQLLIGTIAPIRQAMSMVKNTFDNHFNPNCEEASVPIQLQILISLLIDGCDPNVNGFSQCSKTVAQLTMFHYRKMSKHSSDVVSVRRHPRERETPIPIYLGLKLYATVRSKTLIQRLHFLGVSVSYDRVLFICNNISLNILKNYDLDGVFVSGNLEFGTFMVIAKDNIDVNARSTKIKHHFHGISMTTIQFPSANQPGTKRDVIYDLSSKIDSSHKLDLPSDYAIIQEPPRKKNGPLFMPVCTSNIDYKNFGNLHFEHAKLEETAWLASFSSEKQPWAEYFSCQRINPSVIDVDRTPGNHSLMPLINEQISSLKAQYHIMNIVKKTSHFLNQHQVPIDVSDQPVFAYSQEIQLRYPDIFGYDKYITLLGDLHTEHTILQMHGLLIKGSGLDTALLHCKLSTEGTSAIVDANDIKRARYCLQVTVIVIFEMLKVAHEKSGSTLQVFEWLEEESKTSEMCFYWKLILNFEILALMFVRSIRQGDLDLYLATLYRFLPWFFALDRFNYARWGTIHWFCFVLMKVKCPNEYKEFAAGKFSFQKTNREFSRIALDQLHEQNNRYIKGISGATSLINRQDDSALIRWELCGPEICRILNDYENIRSATEKHGNQKHHENSPTFRNDFAKDTKTLLDSFPNNPFMLDKLTVINNTNVFFEDNIYHNITQLESVGRKQAQSFIEDRLIKSKTSIDTKITLNHFILPGDGKSTKSRSSVVDKRLNHDVLTKLRGALQHRPNHVKLLFSSEIYYSQSLSNNDGSDLYHGTKSTILQKFDKSSIPAIPSASSAFILELSPLFRTGHSGTFNEFAVCLFDDICRFSSGYARIDIVCDRYFKDSLKNLTRFGRGQGPIISFEDDSLLPSKFNDTFLKNCNNKERLNHFMADKFFSLQQEDKQFVITKGDTILSNESIIFSDPLLSDNKAEEADQKLVRHMLQCTRSGVQLSTIRTVDTDVIISLIAYRFRAENFDSKVFACLVTPSSTSYYDINKIALHLGERVCRALPFFYALTGCDIVSSFYNQGKCKFWDRWFEFDEANALTDAFIVLSEKPCFVESNQIDLIEIFIGFVYYGRHIDSINLERVLDFEHSTHSNLRLIPPSRSGLREHIKRAAYYAGWVNFQCVENVELPSPNDWGWTLENGVYKPVWDISDKSITVDLVTSTCGCTSDKCSKCKCATHSLPCLTFCKCKRKCVTIK